MVSRYCDTKSKYALLGGGLSDVVLGDTLVHPSAPIRGGSTQRAAQEVPGHWNSDQLRLVTFANLINQRILDDFKSTYPETSEILLQLQEKLATS